MPNPYLKQLIGLVEDDYFDQAAEWSEETRRVVEAGLAMAWAKEFERVEGDDV